MAGPPVIIWEHDVKRLLHYGELVPRVEDALGKFSRRNSAELVQPVRAVLPLHKHNGYACMHSPSVLTYNKLTVCCCCRLLTLVHFHSFMGLMPSYMESDGVLCTKFVCFYKREDGSTLPAVQSTVVLLDPEYGNVKAVSKTRACHH